MGSDQMISQLQNHLHLLFAMRAETKTGPAGGFATIKSQAFKESYTLNVGPS